MPYINLEQPALTVELPDVILGKTIIGRKAELNHLLYSPNGRIVSISVQVRQYAKNEDDSYGDALGLSEEVKINALTDAFLDMQTLNPLCPINEEYVEVSEQQEVKDENGDTMLDELGNPIMQTITSIILNPILEGKNYAKQFDFYNYVANTQPVIINQIITQRIVAYFQTH